MDIMAAVKRKLSNLAGGVVSSVQSSIPKVSNFFKENPTPASFVSKQIKPVTDYTKTYAQNRYIEPIKKGVAAATRLAPPSQLFQQATRTYSPQKQLSDVYKAGVGAVSLFPDIVGDVAMPLYDYAKGARASSLRGETPLENVKAGLQAASLEKPVGLGSAVTTQPIGETVGNVAELPLMLATIGKIQKGQKLGFDKNTVEMARQGFMPEVKKRIKNFAYQVETSSSPNKKNFKELGDYIHTLAATIWGKEKTANLTNTQLKNAFDVLLEQVENKAPMGRFYPIGMTSRSVREGQIQATPSLPNAPKTAPIEETAILLPFQKDLNRFTALIKQNEKYQTGIPAIGKLKSSQQIASEMGIPHEQLMDQVLGRAGKQVERLPATPMEVIPPKNLLPSTPEGAIPSGKKERGVLQTVRTAKVTSPELQKGIETIPSETRYYTPYSDKKSLENAQSMIATEGIDAVKETVLKGEYNKTNVAAAEVLISKAMKEGRIEEATQMLKTLSLKATTSGQANQAWSMWSRLTPEGMLKYAVKEVLSAKEKMGIATKFAREKLGMKSPELTNEDATLITNYMKRANAAVTDEEKAKFVKLALQTISDKIPLGVSEIIDAYRYNNMLSGLPTHERNFFYNVWNSFITPALTLTAEGKPREAIKYELGAIKAIPKGLDNFYKVMARKIPIDLSKVEIKNVRFQKLPRPITVFSELMEASDKAFSTIIESAEIGRGKSLVEAQKIAEEFLLRTPIGTKGKGILNDSIDSMAKGIEAFGRMFKPVRWSVPFLRTPFNAAKMWLDYSPVGVANLIGNKNKRTVIAKALLGSGATMIGAKLALEGRTTWSVPADKEQKEWFYATKRKPFSVEIGDTWFPAQYFGPFAFALLLPAAANYYYNEAPKALTDGDMGKLGKTLSSVLYFWSQSSPMANLGGFVKTMEGDIDFSLAKNIAFTVSQLKPYEGMLRYIANIFDPVYRKTSTFGEQMISDIPFMTQGLEAYTEPTGKESVREPINFLLPWAIGTANQSYETYFQGRGEELQQNALETQLKNAYTEGKPLPPNVDVKMKADLLYRELKKAVDTQDKKILEQIKKSGLYTPEVKAQAAKYAKLEKLGIMKADRDLLQFEGAARAAEALKRIQTLSPKNQAKHLKLLIDAKIITPEVLAEMKKLYKK